MSLEDGAEIQVTQAPSGNPARMTPDEYRARWGLAKDYPMVAPNYSAARSALAKSLGLGEGRLLRPRNLSQSVKRTPDIKFCEALAGIGGNAVSIKNLAVRHQALRVVRCGR
ncbi:MULTISPECIES: MucR family transcriptional regulator [unclassified Mesorhizobium]|uniref:MucR family transcriptional regulator n=1 Tax=unclassified Mesorhizobium TaxID=325217 RepID=UPI0033359B10